MLKISKKYRKVLPPFVQIRHHFIHCLFFYLGSLVQKQSFLISWLLTLGLLLSTVVSVPQISTYLPLQNHLTFSNYHRFLAWHPQWSIFTNMLKLFRLSVRAQWLAIRAKLDLCRDLLGRHQTRTSGNPDPTSGALLSTGKCLILHFISPVLNLEQK